jgi:Ca2+-transporting ATPase
MTTVFDKNDIAGLSDREAARRLEKEGYNEIPASRRRPGLAIALDVVREPMFLLLIACGILYLILGDLEEALMLLGFVFVVAGITFYQERKTERALEALRDLSSPRALVIRGGEKKRIPGREVVTGDAVLLSEGDRVPADAVVRDSTNLSVDESLLTGESVSVRKTATAGIIPIGRPGGEDTPFVYSGTMIVQGQGIAEILSTGVQTEIGKIGKSLQSLEIENTPLQKQTGKLVKVFALSGAALCIAVFVILGLTKGAWLDGLLAGLTLGMAMLPEEFPVVLTIFLALGAWRISQHRVLTRRVPAVETLGSASVLCVDKTGTLTMNRMSVSELYVDGEVLVAEKEGSLLPDKFHEVVEYAILASPADPFDPMEKAMKDLGNRMLGRTEHLHGDWALLKEYPLTKQQLAMTRVYGSPDGQHLVVASKGAPEVMADLCHLPATERKAIQDGVDLLASRGRRVLGIARASARQGDLPPAQHDFEFKFVGLLGLMDPVRPEVADAVEECYRAGIRVMMITGDYPGTAENIAQQIHLRNSRVSITGSDLQEMDNAELAERVRTVNIFARMVPEQKLRLVEALKRNGEVVAMTGDGVNDAPALISAHIGIAMGGRGTDVARESASLVLLDDDFGSIVRAVRMGRRIYDNLKKAVMFIFSVHIPIAGMSLIPVIFGWPLALFPVHIVFLELIIDPACSLVFEAEREGRDVMNRPPRKLDEPLFGLRNLLPSLLQGLTVLLVVLGIYAWALSALNEPAARALSFTAMVLSNIGLILTNRAWPSSVLSTLREANLPFLGVTAGAIAFITLSLTIPALREIFRFAPVVIPEIALCVVGALLSILIAESLKLSPMRKLLERMGR